jgi:hypothetical protein
VFPIKSPTRPVFVAGNASLSCVALMLIWLSVISGHNPMKRSPQRINWLFVAHGDSLLMPFLLTSPDFGPGP